MAFQMIDLPDGIGTQVTGLDMDNDITQAEQKKLYDAWIDSGIMVFKQAGKSIEHQLKLSLLFGKLDTHPVKTLVTESQYPEIMVLESKAQSKLSVYYRQQQPEQLFIGFIPWHSDLIFTTSPNHGAMLRAVEIPKRGGETAWIDTIAAYEALAPEIQERIESLEVEYRFCTSLLDARFGRDPQLRMQLKGERNFPQFPPVVHPLVRHHPVSGRKILNLSPLHLVRVVGIPQHESDALLLELTNHVTNRQFCYIHSWEPNDMVLWDNWRTLHSALGYPLGDSRLVHRTTISGDVQMGRVLEAGLSG